MVKKGTKSQEKKPVSIGIIKFDVDTPFFKIQEFSEQFKSASEKGGPVLIGGCDLFNFENGKWVKVE